MITYAIHNPALQRNFFEYDPCVISAVHVQVDRGNMSKIRERERERERESVPKQHLCIKTDEHSNAQSPVYIWKTGLALF